MASRVFKNGRTTYQRQKPSRQTVFPAYLQHILFCPLTPDFYMSEFEFYGVFARLSVSTHSEKICTVCCSFAALPRTSLPRIYCGKIYEFLKKQLQCLVFRFVGLNRIDRSVAYGIFGQPLSWTAAGLKRVIYGSCFLLGTCPVKQSPFSPRVGGEGGRQAG